MNIDYKECTTKNKGYSGATKKKKKKATISPKNATIGLFEL